MADDVQSQNPSKRNPTQAELLALLKYNRVFGDLTWIASETPRHRDKIGKPAGTMGSVGYWQVQIGGRVYLAHRVIWCMMTGRWPTETIDHENLDKSDNRWRNLRKATRTQNQCNRRGNNKLGKGVNPSSPGSFRARIRVNGKKISLGSFKTAEEAKAAYERAALKYHGKFARFD